MSHATPDLRVQHVVQKTGIPRNTLIAWERRHGIVQPTRSPNGYRVYSASDVARLIEVKSLVDQGYRISDVAQMLAETRSPVASTTTGPEGLRRDILSRLLSFDVGAADDLGSQLLMPFEHQIDQVLLPMLREVGDGWERGELTVAQEHCVTVWCRARIEAMLRRLSLDANDRRPVIVAGYPGERHEIGLLATASKLANRGVPVCYLGLDVPATDACETARRLDAQAIVQSLVIRPAASELQAHLRQTLRDMPSDCLLVLGGPGVAVETSPPRLWVCHDPHALAIRLLKVAPSRSADGPASSR